MSSRYFHFSGGMLTHTSSQHLSNQCGWQRTVCWKTDSPFTDAVALELVFVGFNGVGPRIERAVIRAGSKGRQELSVQPECGDAITDAFLRIGYCCTDGSSKLFQCESLFAAHTCKKLV